MCDSLPRISLLTKPVKIDQSDGIPDPGIPEWPWLDFLSKITFHNKIIFHNKFKTSTLFEFSNKS